MKQAIAIILSFSIAMIGAILFFDGCGNKPPTVSVSVPAVNLQKQASEIEKQYVLEITRLTRENDSLKGELALRKKMLLISRSEVSTAKTEVVRMIVKEKTIRDTVLKIVYCDSLQCKVDSLIAKEAVHDSLNDQQLVGFVRQAQTQDSALAVCQKSYSDLKSVAGGSFEQQKALTDQLNEANGKLQRRTTENRLMSAGLLILSGIAASTFVFHR
jgi:hypothetical protein